MGWMQRLSEGLTKTRSAVRGSLDRLLGRAVDPALLDEFEATLISSDLGVSVAERVISQLKEALKGTDASQVTHVQNSSRSFPRPPVPPLKT
jgi:fused signal recognition particle receptor